MSIKQVALVGNPNCGKTTLFNGLTGGKQTIGNWPGVTVEKKEGLLKTKDEKINVVDLPGIYSLAAHSEDEKVARDYILSGEPDLIINILDSTNLERNLYLTTQLIEMQKPMLILLNRADLAKKQNIEINSKLMSADLDCKVIDISALDKKDIELTRNFIIEILNSKEKIANTKIGYPDELESFISKYSKNLTKLSKKIGANERWIATKILEEDQWVLDQVYENKCIEKSVLKEEIEKIESVLDESVDVIVADYRYGYIYGLVKQTVKKHALRKKFSDVIDKFVLNRLLGVPVFLGIMYLVFWTVMNIGGAFIDFFDIFFGTIFVDGFAELLTSIGTPEWMITIFANGVGAGIQTVATFVPIIFMMFLMLSILEDSGYMARAAFVMDKLMRFIGLPGKSFVSMIVGFGCTVPGVMATRTLENKRDRMLTVFMTPFMSCGARLPVYVLFAAAFFPKNSGNMVFSLYLVGILMAILTGLLLKKTLFKGEASHFVMELPAYNLPRVKHIFIHTWSKLKSFIFKAGAVIIIIVTILGSLNSFGTDGTFGNEDSDKSVLSAIGKTITPIFKPMGIDENNWPASVALFTGIFAKEAVVGTLNSLYSQNEAAEEESKTEFSLTKGLGEAFNTIPANLSGIGEGLADPLGVGLVSETDKDKISDDIGADKGIFALMNKYFSKGPAQAYAYLLFILLYFPCVAAFAAVVREIGQKLAWLLAGYVTLIGWVVSTLFYQLTTGYQFEWIAFSIILIGFIITGLNLLAKRTVQLASIRKSNNID